MPYNTSSIRTPLIRACNKAIQKRLALLAPNAYLTAVDKDGNKQQSVQTVPIKFGGDERQYTEYETPSLILFNPTMTQFRELITHEDAYKDFDYDSLTAKEFPEPIPVKIRYVLHAATRNPDNDASLLEFFLRLQREMSYLDIELLADTQQYDRVEVIWYDPTEIDSRDVSKIREIQFDVIAWLEVLNYKEVRLLEPGNAVGFIESNYKRSKYYLKTRSSLDVPKGSTEILVSESLVGWPVQGRCAFGKDEFTYTSRTTGKFMGVVGIKHYHVFDSLIEFCADEESPPSPPEIIIPKPFPATWLEQSGAVIHGEVEGLAIGEFEWVKPNGAVETSPIVDWPVVPEGQGKLVVKDEAKLLNLSRVLIEVIGPAPYTPPLPDWNTVPDVTGMSLGDATLAIVAAEFVVGTVEYVYSTLVPIDLVVAHCPEAGTQVLRGEAVNLFISLGPEPPVYGTIPDVSNLTLVDAENAIIVAGFTLGTVGYATSETILLDRVVSQCPEAGLEVKFVEPVDVVLSSGAGPLEWLEQAGTEITASVNGLGAGEFVWDKADGSSSTDAEITHVGGSGKSRLRVYDAADLTKLERVQLDIRGPVDKRLTEIPVYLCIGNGATNNLRAHPTTAFDWIHPDGTVQSGNTCIYTSPQGTAGYDKVLIRCKPGFTVADLTQLMYGNTTICYYKTEDFIHCRPSAYFYQLLCLIGDVKYLKDVVGSPATGIYISSLGVADRLYGSINDWLPVKAEIVLINSMCAVSGVLKFQNNAPTSDFSFSASTSFSYADVAQTIINWDACNPNSFARTGNFNMYKRSLIGAANPAAEAAIVSLISKGASFTFAAP